MTPPEYGVWLILGAVTLMAITMVFLPVRGGHGQHAHAGPGTLTVRHLTATTQAFQPAPDDEESDDAIMWPPEPEQVWPEPEATPLERNLARLCAAPDGEYIGRHRLGEPPPGWHLELTATSHLVAA